MADDEDIPPPFLNPDAILRENVSSLLQSWGLPELRPRFKSHQVEIRSLFCLTERDICELIPKIGRRAIFRSNLVEWRRKNRRHAASIRLSKRYDSKDEEDIPLPQLIIKDEVHHSDLESAETTEANIQNNDDTTVEEMDTEQQPPERPQSEPIEGRRYSISTPKKRSHSQFNINEILSNSYEGQQIIAYYEVNGNFDYSHRRRLVSLLINEVIRENRWLVQDDFTNISKDIIQMFPREEESTYYTARNGTRNPKGCLYNKFLNLTRKLRQEGILQYRNSLQLLPERTSTRHSGEIRCYRESS